MTKVKITREFQTADGKGVYTVSAVPHIDGTLRCFVFHSTTEHPDINGEDVAKQRAFDYAKALEVGGRTTEVVYETPDTPELSSETIETINL